MAYNPNNPGLCLCIPQPGILRVLFQEPVHEPAGGAHPQGVLAGMVQPGAHQARAQKPAFQFLWDAGMGEQDDLPFQAVLQYCHLVLDVDLEAAGLGVVDDFPFISVMDGHERGISLFHARTAR